MDIEELLIGFILILIGIIISILLIGNNGLGKDFQITKNTIGLAFASLLGIFGGLYFVLKSL